MYEVALKEAFITPLFITKVKLLDLWQQGGCAQRYPVLTQTRARYYLAQSAVLQCSTFSKEQIIKSQTLLLEKLKAQD